MNEVYWYKSLSYSDVNIVCVVIILTLLIITSIYMRKLKTKLDRLIIAIGTFYSVSLLSDAIRVLNVDGWKYSESIFKWTHFLFWGGIIMAAGCWLVYITEKTGDETHQRLFGKLLTLAPALTVTIVNYFMYGSKSRIYVGNEQVYADKGWVIFLLIVIYAYYIISAAFAVFSFVDSPSRDRVSAIIYIVFVGCIVGSEVAQRQTNVNYTCIGMCAAIAVILYKQISDSSFTQRDELVHFANIMDSLKNEYIAILYVDLDNYKFEPYVVSEEFNRKIDFEKIEYDYFRFVDSYIDHTVYSADREKYRKSVEPKYIREMLAEQEMFSVKYRVVDSGDIYYYEMNIWRAKDDHNFNNVVIGYRDKTQEQVRNIKEQKKNAVIQGLVDDYEYLCYINFANGDIEQYHVSELFANILKDDVDIAKVRNLFEIIRDDVDISDEDIDRSRVDREVIFEEMGEDRRYAVEARLDIGAGSKYYNIQFLADAKNPEAVIIGVLDVDEQVSAKLEQKEREKEREYNIQLETTITDRTIELHEKAMSLNKINEDIIELLGNITEARDTESGTHIKRVKGFTHILASQVMKDYPEYGLTEEMVELITSASALHDVGKIMIPDAILLKPGRFEPEEFEIMKSHCNKGCDILRNAPTGWSKEYLRFSTEICHYHHEKWDGRGYPEGLSGEDIPVSAQIVAVADCFDALTTQRVYKPAYTPEEAYNMILNGECGNFNPKMMEAFKKTKDEFISYVEDAAQIYSSVSFGATTSHSLTGIKLLLVEDNELTRKITKEILEEEGATVFEAEDGASALSIIEQCAYVDFDAILMDIRLPDIDGCEVTRRVRKMDFERAEDIPIIALTSEVGNEIKAEAVEAGMNAFLTKPVSITAITKQLLKSMRYEQDSLKKKLDEVIIRANRDPLTGVKNLTAYTEAVENITKKITDKEEVRFAIVQCDINNLKQVNDNLGHDMGDVYIKNCCKIICDIFDHSPVYRIGGDEFEVLLNGNDYENRDECMQRLYAKIAETSKIKDVKDGRASLAAGIAVFDPVYDKTVAVVAKRADEEMYKNKRFMKFSGDDE